MEKDELKSYEKAFLLTEDALGFAEKLVKEKAKVLDIANAVESRIMDIGGKPAWPVNISINEIAAHYTPSINDQLALKDGDMVKIDVGVQVNGYLCDRAFTVCIGKKTHPLIEASKKALEECLKLFVPGTKVCEISQVCEDTVNKLGFNVIRNLAGHRIDRYSQHESPSIPNGKNSMKDEIEAGKVYAMEVFVTDGSGLVVESSPAEIFQYNSDSPVRMWEARKLLELAKGDFEQLPFTRRWISGISPLKIDMALKQLLQSEAIIEFPPLKEESNGMVAVTEKSVIVK
ncbi:MAG: type II methionyl aminopeptidase [Candidatus Aenigmarchaeota archaeon]|nr:type II methionyl aminopeptidase [Candidatus Aenigmarchaeota archaeon]